MAINFCVDPARLLELAFAREVTYGTFVDPNVQLVHNGFTWGRGHTPIEGVASTSTSMMVITHRAIRGLDLPFVNMTVPLGPSTRDVLMELLTGSVLGAVTPNVWDINDFPTSYSVGVNVQRSGGNSYYKFAGGFMGQATLTLPLGAEAELQMALSVTSLVDPITAPTTFPTLVPATAGGAFVLKDGLLRHSATDSFAGSGIPFSGMTLNFTRNLIVSHTSSGTEPQCITPSTFDLTGTIDFRISSDWLSEFQTIIATENDVGFTTRYVDLTLVSGATTLRLTMPVRLDTPSLDGSNLEDGVQVPINFIAAGDDATPTVPTIRVRDAA